MKKEFNFKKKYGQNFLKNEAIIKRIVEITDIKEDALIIEVGPGEGALTKFLAQARSDCKVLCYEIDRELEDPLTLILKDYSNVKVLFGDFLDQNIKEDIKDISYSSLYFVSNVPYYITTPILFKLMESNLVFDKIVMMVQKEVGERFTSPPSKKEYGALTVLLNYDFKIKREIQVDRNQFVPKPNVDSVVVSFTPKENKEQLMNRKFFQSLVHDAFQFKRKTIKNNLKEYNLETVEEVLQKYNYDLTVRAESLSYEVFVELANRLYNHKR